MLNRVQYPDAIEPLVQFIEETPPAEILDRTLEKLRAGVSTQTMLTASALAVTRSSDLPPGHHGGPLHPLAGLYAVTKLVDRLEGEQKFVPVLQHVALSNKHINDPATGPYSLLEFAPLDAGGVEATKAAFLKAVNRGESNKADHLFQWLWKNVPAIEAFDLLMTVAIPKNALDDHYFMFPAPIACPRDRRSRQGVSAGAHAAGGALCDAPASPPNPMPSPLPAIDALIEEHQLLSRVLRQRTGDDETAVIGELGEAIGRVDVFAEIPELIAKALADGLSLEGAGEALSIGAAGLFLRSLTGNPMDVHLHTSANLRRYLLRLDGLSARTSCCSCCCGTPGRRCARRRTGWSRPRSRIWRRSRPCRPHAG